MSTSHPRRPMSGSGKNAQRPKARRSGGRARGVLGRPAVVRSLALLAGALVLAALGVFAFRGNAADAGSSTSPTAFDLPALHGTDRVTLAEYEGKPLVVNFFASWCTACDFELPGFAKVSGELRGKVTFVGVSSLETGDRDLMPNRHHITWWPLAQDVGGSNGSGLHDALGGGNSMPLTAFYDASGRLLAVDRAALPEDALRQRIRSLYQL